MNIVSEVENLLRDLASHLHGKNSKGDASGILSNFDPSTDDDACLYKVSLLNKSLNFNGSSPLLDTALSMLCYQASDVHSSMAKYLVGTLIAVLMSSISCRVIPRGTCSKSKNCEVTIKDGALLQQMTEAKSVAEGCHASETKCLQKADILQIGSLISSNDCKNLVEACLDVIELDHHGEFSHLLVHALLKVATSTSSYKVQFPSSSMIYERFKYESVSSISRLQIPLTSVLVKGRWNAQFRQLTWFLHPLSLKEDVSLILRDSIKRPFLSLRTALHEKMEWRSIMISLVSSPAMFMEVRSLLHRWLLCTGLNAILSLHTQLVSSLFDILARPTFWGIPMELGLLLPFPCAFFPVKQKQILEVLSGPISSTHFQELISLIEQYTHASRMVEPMTTSSLDGTYNLSASNTMPVDDNSTWAMLLDFPAWFYFAATLLFHWNQCGDHFEQSECEPNADATEHKFSDLRVSHVNAARYLSWILSPTDSAHQNMIVESLNEGSIMWKKCHRVDACQLDPRAGSIHISLERKLKKAKGRDVRKDDVTSSSKNYFLSVRTWLESFQSRCLKYDQKAGFSCSVDQVTIANESTKKRQPADTHIELCLLIRKIPLGIFIGNVASLDDSECEVLLHYVATGQILVQEETKPGDRNMNQRSATHEQVENKFLLERSRGMYFDWVRGSAFVFDLFDILEDILPEIFGYDDYTLELIFQAKTKAGRYLSSCIRNLLQVSGGLDVEMLTDLQIRFLRWMKQGREFSDGHDEYDELAHSLNCRLSSLKAIII